MTSIAHTARIDMTCMLTGSDTAIMTTGTDTQHLRMVNTAGGQRLPWRRRRQVTRLTHITASDMGRSFTLRNAAIVTTGAGTQYLGMIHRTRRQRRPRCRRW